MQILGLLSLLVVVAIGAVWLVSGLEGTQVKQDGTESSVSYQEAVDSAKDVTGGESAYTGRTVTIYRGITVPENIEVLDLSRKGLTGSLKAEVRKLKKLRELNLSNNKFTGVPAELGQLSNLEILNLSNNPLTGLPHELSNLSKLKSIDIRGTNVSAYDLEVIRQGLPLFAEVKTDINI